MFQFIAIGAYFKKLICHTPTVYHAKLLFILELSGKNGMKICWFFTIFSKWVIC